MVEYTAKRSAALLVTEDIMDICRRSGNGDADARRRLMELLSKRIHKTAFYLTRNRQEAKDIAQSACIEVLLSAGSFRGDASLGSWADRVTFRTAGNLFAKRARRRKIQETYFMPPPSVSGTDENADHVEARLRLRSLLQTLKITHREVLVLQYIHGYTIKETAEFWGVPVETARCRLKKARVVFKKKVLKDPLLKEWVEDWIER